MGSDEFDHLSDELWRQAAKLDAARLILIRLVAAIAFTKDDPRQFALGLLHDIQNELLEGGGPTPFGLGLSPKFDLGSKSHPDDVHGEAGALLLDLITSLPRATPSSKRGSSEPGPNQ